MDEAPSWEELVLAMAELQGRVGSGFLRANQLRAEGDYEAAVEAHREYREAQASYLEMALLHNRLGYPSPWAIDTIVQPLVQQALMEADLLAALGRSDEAVPLREWAHGVAREHLPPGMLARLRRDEAAQLALSGRFNEALTLFEEIQDTFASEGDVLQSAQTALDLAVALDWLGDVERALDAVARAKELVEPQLGDRPPVDTDIAAALLREATAIFGGEGPTGESDRAAALWRVAVELDEHEARIRKQLGDLDEAERLFLRVLPTYEGLGVRAAVEYQLAAINVLRERYGEARSRLMTIAPDFEGDQLRPRRPGLRVLQADVELGEALPEAALKLAEDGLADLERFPDFDLAWKLQWRRARALHALNRPDEALEAYDEAAGTVDSLRRAPLGYRLDSTSLASKVPLFEAAIDLAMERGAAENCCRLIELVKARALSTILSVPVERRADRSPLEVEFDRVTERLDAIEYESYRGEGTVELRTEHDRLVTRRRELAERIRLSDPRWRSLSGPVPFDPTGLLSRLDERRQAAITLYYRPQRVVAVLLAAGGVRVAGMDLDPEVGAALDRYGQNLLQWKPDPYLFDPSEELGITADALVPRELLEEALAADSLVVAPHRELNLLPWPGLALGGRRLFEHVAVGVLPNLSCLGLLDRDFAPTPRAALIGAPDYRGLENLGDLPEVGPELEDVEAMYRDRSALVEPTITGSEATEEAFRRLIGRGQIEHAVLHAACHGTLDAGEPMASGLLLTDGKIDAGELALGRMGFGEVVLSACSTGWRPQAAEGISLSGDEVLGLPGGLLEAGAGAILVSIPRAEDVATRSFMTRYHDARTTGGSPLEAFRSAQLAMLADPSVPVFHWLGFVSYATR